MRKHQIQLTFLSFPLTNVATGGLGCTGYRGLASAIWVAVSEPQKNETDRSNRGF